MQLILKDELLSKIVLPQAGVPAAALEDVLPSTDFSP